MAPPCTSGRTGRLSTTPSRNPSPSARVPPLVCRGPARELPRRKSCLYSPDCLEGFFSETHMQPNESLCIDAVRKRIQRNTISWEKDEEGRIYVFLLRPRRVKPTSKTRPIRPLRLCKNSGLPQRRHSQPGRGAKAQRHYNHDYGPAHPRARSPARGARIPSKALGAGGEGDGSRRGEALLVAEDVRRIGVTPSRKNTGGALNYTRR